MADMFASDRDKVAHLLRRFGLGASEAEIDYYGREGWLGAVDKLLDYKSRPDALDMTPSELAEQALPNGLGKGTKAQFDALQVWWIARMVRTQRPLEEKMTLFWHDHFATSGEKVTDADMMLRQNQILRANATGKFHTLLSSVSKDPAMLFWLDNEFNVKEHPNENFAREVMELFTLGIGNYTEKDIQEAARAFTGWTLATPGQANRKANKNPKNGKLAKNQVFDEGLANHDEGIKTILGDKGNFNGDDVLGILCGKPRCAWYITWKLWEFFAYRSPEKALIDRLAQKFDASGLDIAVLLREIMTAPEFYSSRAYRAIYKNPIDFTVATLRQLGFASAEIPDLYRTARAVKLSAKAMGMDIVFPPDVSGWGGGERWVTTATIVERIKWGGTLFGASSVQIKKNSFNLAINAADLFVADPTPSGVARTLASILDAPLEPAKVDLLTQAIQRESNGRITQQNANIVASAATRLIFGAPEFQFS